MCASDVYLPLCESHVMLMLDFEGSVLGDHLINASNVIILNNISIVFKNIRIMLNNIRIKLNNISIILNNISLIMLNSISIMLNNISIMLSNISVIVKSPGRDRCPSQRTRGRQRRN